MATQIGLQCIVPEILYIISEAVIPANAGIQIRKTEFQIKPGMTIICKVITSILHKQKHVLYKKN